MAASHHPTTQYNSTQFLESCGAILFKQSTKQICLVYSNDRQHWLLAKGRRNVGERRIDAAIREVREETGWPCQAMAVNLYSRATPWDEEPQSAANVTPDVPRYFEGVANEAFMVTHRVLPEKGIKLIYWYLAAVEEGAPKGEQEALYAESRFFGFEEAVATLTFATDREVVKRAIEIYEETTGKAKREPGST